MKEPHIEFTKDGVMLCQYTVRGTFPGELEATRELLAEENGCRPEDIEVHVRGGRA